jgi:hypothetical protein
MTPATASITSLTPAVLDDRRLAVENAVGSLRIEGMELEPVPSRILERYAQGEIPLDEMSRLIHEYTSTIL